MLKVSKFCNANIAYTFKNVNKTFSLKAQISCNDSFNIIYVHICSGWLEEYIWETGVDKTRLRDMIRVYRQHIKQTVSRIKS